MTAGHCCLAKLITCQCDWLFLKMSWIFTACSKKGVLYGYHYELINTQALYVAWIVHGGMLKYHWTRPRCQSLRLYFLRDQISDVEIRATFSEYWRVSSGFWSGVALGPWHCKWVLIKGTCELCPWGWCRETGGSRYIEVHCATESLIIDQLASQNYLKTMLAW